MPVASETLVEDGSVKKHIKHELLLKELMSSVSITAGINYNHKLEPLLHLKAADLVIEIKHLVPMPVKLTVASLINDFSQHKAAVRRQSPTLHAHTNQRSPKYRLGRRRDHECPMGRAASEERAVAYWRGDPARQEGWVARLLWLSRKEDAAR